MADTHKFIAVLLPMTSINTILKALKNIPADKLEEIHTIICSIKLRSKNAGVTKRQILAFGGCFRDFYCNGNDYFLEEANRTRANLFDRDIYI